MPRHDYIVVFYSKCFLNCNVDIGDVLRREGKKKLLSEDSGGTAEQILPFDRVDSVLPTFVQALTVYIET